MKKNHTLDGIINGLKTAETKISKLEGIAIETKQSQTKAQKRKKQAEKNEETYELGTISSFICFFGVP